MDLLEQNIQKAKSICNGSIKYIHRYSKIYTFSTENVSGYQEYFDLKNKSLLTVGSSGDQVLNAYYNGARDITLLDINEFAKYYVYLKISAILSLNYLEFQQFFFLNGINNYNNPDYFSKKIFKKIEPTIKLLDDESYIFFNELFIMYQPNEIRKYLFDDDERRNVVIKNYNIYLKDETTYDKLKLILKNISLNYINADIFSEDIPLKYDNIYLSNLCTTTTLKKLKLLLNKLDKNNLNIDGSILIGYLWNSNINMTDFSENWKDIYNMTLTKEILKEYITEHHNINGSKDFLWDRNKKSDMILIYRKK